MLNWEESNILRMVFVVGSTIGIIYLIWNVGRNKHGKRKDGRKNCWDERNP